MKRSTGLISQRPVSMPEMTGEVTVRSLLIALGVMGVGVTAFCVGLTIAARQFPPGTVWVGAGILVGGLCLIAFGRLYLQPLVIQELSLAYAAFFLAALLGLPSAAAVWVAIGRAARLDRRSILFDSFLVTVAFFVVVPLAAIVAAIPDIVTLLG